MSSKFINLKQSKNGVRIKTKTLVIILFCQHIIDCGPNDGLLSNASPSYDNSFKLDAGFANYENGSIDAGNNIDGSIETTIYASPTNEDIRDIWGTSNFTVAVGDHGTVLTYNGSYWQKMHDVPTISDLYSVWGTSQADFFVAGNSATILHFNGASWIDVGPGGYTPSFRGVYGSKGKVFAVARASSGNSIYAFDGISFKPIKNSAGGELYDIWGHDGRFFAVGSGGKIISLDENGWSTMSSPTPQTLNGIWGRSLNEVYAVGDDGIILRYDTSGWKVETMLSNTHMRMTSTWTDSSGVVYVVGFFYAGSTPSNAGFVMKKVNGTWHTFKDINVSFLESVWGINGLVWVSGLYGTLAQLGY